MKKELYIVGSIEAVAGAILLCVAYTVKELFPITLPFFVSIALILAGIIQIIAAFHHKKV